MTRRNPRGMSAEQEAFLYCEGIAKTHYENFPIGWFIPKELRRFVYAVYAFARTADDFSDEESFEGRRIAELDRFEVRMDKAIGGSADEPLFIAIAETVAKTGLDPQLLKDLLTAFRQDVTKRRYQNYRELESYCVYSANPVGRIVLHLFGYRDDELLKLSDRICTGIQLVNHWQDIGVDLSKDRIYLPEEDMKRFGYSYGELQGRKLSDAFRDLMRFEISRTRSLFYEGKGLLEALGRRLKWQVSLMWLGPMKILERIEAADYDVFHSRPALTRRDKLKLVLSLPGL